MIKEITVTNFKSIREVTLSLNPVNILIGPNGAGKSNFINFFKFVDTFYNQQLGIYTSQRGGADRILHLGRKSSEHLSGEINFNDTWKYSFRLAPNDQNNFFIEQESINHNQAKLAPLFGSGWISWNYGEANPTGSESPLTRMVSSQVVDYYKAKIESFRVYHFHDTSVSAPLRQTARVPDDRSLRADGGNLAALLLRLGNQNPLAFRRLEQTIRQVAPFFERFDLNPDGDFVRLTWRQQGSDMYLDASDLSDGTLRFIALCTLLLQPEPPKTIIIDEPELGLHPYAINVLAGLIRSVSAQTQVIVSTQSVGLINNFSPDDIIVVTNEGNESKFKRLNESQLADWLREYSLGELWQKNVFGGNP